MRAAQLVPFFDLVEIVKRPVFWWALIMQLDAATMMHMAEGLSYIAFFLGVTVHLLLLFPGSDVC